MENVIDFNKKDEGLEKVIDYIESDPDLLRHYSTMGKHGTDYSLCLNFSREFGVVSYSVGSFEHPEEMIQVIGYLESMKNGLIQDLDRMRNQSDR